MSILLITPHDFERAALDSILESHELNLHALLLDSGLAEALPFEGLDACALVSAQQGTAETGERVQQARRLIGDAVPLIVCGPRLPDPGILHRCGASVVVTPRSWAPGAVAERLLAELVAAGKVEPSSCGALRGASSPMRALYRDIEVVAPLAETALILGETGTGKELVAHELHDRSGRPGELLAINCAALTADLVESELFGHHKGAFSGAVANRQGLLLEAGRGTVFLDEIGELSAASQAKLLRVVEERRVRPVGGNQWRPFAARILVATNRDLEREIDKSAFRRDLFERISGFALTLPPLRERKADLVLLAEHFVVEYDREYDGHHRVPHEALDPLFRYDWPGNVRQLRHTLRQAAAYAADDAAIDIYRLHEAVQRRPSLSRHTVDFDPASESWGEVHDRIREQYLRSVLEETGGNKSEAIKRSGFSRSRFYEIFEKINAEEEAAKVGNEAETRNRE